MSDLSQAERERLQLTDDRLEHYDVPALIADVLGQPNVCPRNSCAAPTLHLLATLLHEALASLDAAEKERDELAISAKGLRDLCDRTLLLGEMVRVKDVVAAVIAVDAALSRLGAGGDST